MSTTPDSSFQKQRIAIGLATGPNPPWTGKYFRCKCGAEYQLCASDELESAPIAPGGPARCSGCAYWFAPPCWTCGCAFNVIVTQRFPHEDYKPLSAKPADENFQEGNPS